MADIAGQNRSPEIAGEFSAMNERQAYQELLSRSREIAHLDSAMELAYWDQRINVPVKGHAHRVRHLAALAKMRYRRFTDSRIGDLLSTIENSGFIENPLTVQGVNIREWRRLYNRLKAIPEKLAVEIVRATTEAEAIWERARPRNDWRRLRAVLERIVTLKRQEAEEIGYDREPYDALLKDYEPGETAEKIDRLLKELSTALVPLLDRLIGKKSSERRARVDLSAPIAVQETFAHEVAHQLGYGVEGGRIDVSAHPFATGLGPGDVRITARYREQDFREGFFAVVHETGHALYVQGLPMEHWGEPMCHVASLSMDESQSLIWEYFVARSNGFWRYFSSRAQAAFPRLGEIAMDDFFIAVNEVAPDSLRVNADEVTYNLHIALRFELERDLVNQSLEVADLPAAWNEKSREYLGHEPTDYAHGVMQDVHWFSGLIGYFPTYTLGHLYAAQLFLQAERELGDLEEQFVHGEFAPLRGWLREHVHAQGSRFRPRELIERITGESLNPKRLIEYLEAKYTRLYGL